MVVGRGNEEGMRAARGEHTLDEPANFRRVRSFYIQTAERAAHQIAAALSNEF
jgi:hypothetical protein